MCLWINAKGLKTHETCCCHHTSHSSMSSKAMVLFYPLFHRQDSIYHSLLYQSRNHERSIDEASHHKIFSIRIFYMYFPYTQYCTYHEFRITFSEHKIIHLLKYIYNTLHILSTFYYFCFKQQILSVLTTKQTNDLVSLPIHLRFVKCHINYSFVTSLYFQKLHKCMTIQ